MVDRMRVLWDLDDLEESERRFRKQLGEEANDAGRGEVLTQLARVEGLRGDFEACERLLDEAEPLGRSNAVATVRLELERGRMHRSSGDPEAAFPLFQSAFGRALEAGEYYLAGDAAHMCAIAVGDLGLQEEWTQRGLDLGEREPAAAYWAGPLLNNLGWAYSGAGDHERALELFEQALVGRRRDPDNATGIAWADYAVGYTLRRLDRSAEALPLLEQAATVLPGDSYVEGELEAVRAALSRRVAVDGPGGSH
jgi:tetratricopeptide (TPR) repeat protein